ncbi:MAG TPA: flagellar export chaperone FliS [Nocardioidaceae bacterium]|nr:flagellar export chaperone FliS [Nocardioidaceae bacterium]
MKGTARAAYQSQMVETASPAKLLVMLFDRLVVDIRQAEVAQFDGDFETASQRLVHAQDIVLELSASLRHDVWDGSERLASLYAYLHSELVRANIKRDPEVTGACLRIVEPLAEAWREAALAPVAG